MTDDAPSWRTDPTGRFEHRYWDGQGWTDNVAVAGVASTDPYEPAPPDAATFVDPTTVDAAVAEPVAPVGTDAGVDEPTAVQPAASWPPPPPPPPSFAPPGGPSGPVSADDDSKRRRLLIGGGILAAIVIVVAALLLLGGGDDDGGADRIAADDSAEDRGKDADDTTDANPFGDGSEIPADLEDQLAEVYESSLGLPQDKAECLAGKIADAIESGDLTEDQAMQDMFGYLSDCDIDMSELTGAGAG